MDKRDVLQTVDPSALCAPRSQHPHFGLESKLSDPPFVAVDPSALCAPRSQHPHFGLESKLSDPPFVAVDPSALCAPGFSFVAMDTGTNKSTAILFVEGIKPDRPETKTVAARKNLLTSPKGN